MASTTNDRDRHEWIQVDVTAAVDSAELLGLLDVPLVMGAWQVGDLLHLYWPAATWGPDNLKSLRSALACLGCEPDNSGVTVNRLPDRDWNAEWARQVRPIRVGPFVIRPSWHHVELKPGDVELIIDPKQAFGTGHHATTQLLLEWLPELVGPADLVLDVGTGSGILAMAALRLGAQVARGVDNDAVAIDCAKEYAQVNGLDERLSLEVLSAGEEGGNETFVPTLVLANVDRRTLLAVAEPLARYVAQGARLLLSGILPDQRSEIEQAYAAHGAYPAQARERDGWLAMELIAMEGCEGVYGK